MNRKKSNGILGNAFCSNFWNSKIVSEKVGAKETVLGYVFGPFGIMMLQSIVLSYFNQYLTDVLGFTVSKGVWIASFMVIFPVLSKIIDAITNVIMSKIMDNTDCRQGKLRPWFIMSLPVVIFGVIMMYWIPLAGVISQAIWVVIAYNIFYAVGYTMWYMPYEMMAALSTRNSSQRSRNSMAGTITKNMGTGVISIFFPTIMNGICELSGGVNRTGYLLTMAIMCVVAVPLTFIQYFYTRERITEERRAAENDGSEKLQKDEKRKKLKEVSFGTQMKACLKDKYWIMFVVMILAYQIFNALKTVALIYYSGWVVEGNAYGSVAAIQAKFQVIAMSPTLPALLIMLPMIKKHGRTFVIRIGAVLTILGTAAAFFNAGNTVIIYAGTAIHAIGSIAYVYTMMTFTGDVLDHVEWKQNVRCEGITAAFVGAVHCVSNGIGQGLFNLGLMLTRYESPREIGKTADGVRVFANQTKAATGWINFSFQGSLMCMGILFAIMFFLFFDLEKHVGQMQQELVQRKAEHK